MVRHEGIVDHDMTFFTSVDGHVLEDHGLDNLTMFTIVESRRQHRGRRDGVCSTKIIVAPHANLLEEIRISYIAAVTPNKVNVALGQTL